MDTTRNRDAYCRCTYLSTLFGVRRSCIHCRYIHWMETFNRLLLESTPYERILRISVRVQPAEPGASGAATCALLRPCKDCNRLMTFPDIDARTSLCMDCQRAVLRVQVGNRPSVLGFKEMLTLV